MTRANRRSQTTKSQDCWLKKNSLTASCASKLRAVLGQRKFCIVWTWREKSRSSLSTRTPKRWTGFQGVIAGTVAQKPYTMSYYGLTFLDDLHHNAVHEFKNWRTAPASPLPSFVDTGTAWVDKSNVGAFKSALASYERPFGPQ